MACAEDLEALESLLASNPPLEETNDEGWTALFFALGRFGGMPRCVERLLKAGADPNHRTNAGKSALDVLYEGVNSASEHNRAKGIERILRRHGFRGDKWWSWMHEGVRHTVEISKDALIWTRGSHGPSKTQRNRDFEAVGPLYALSAEAEEALCRQFGLESPLSVRTPDERRLLEACIEDDLEGARRSLRSGAPVDTRDVVGDTALILALRRRRARIVRLLLESGADAAAKGRGGREALCWALARDHHSSIIGELLCAGAPHDSRDAEGRTPLHWALAVTTPDPASVEWLLTAGASPDAKDNEGVTPMMLARTKGIETMLTGKT